MDHKYGVHVTNKFSLFLDEEDPDEIIAKQEEESKSKKKDGDKKGSKKLKKAPPAPEVKKTPEPGFKKDGDKPAPRQDRGRGGFRNRENRDFQDSDRRPQFRQGPRDNRGGDENTPPEFRERREGGGGFGRRDGEGGFGGERGRGGRGRGRGGRGGERGGFGPRGGFRGGFGGDRRREFDRHSGTDRTGVKAFDKREGGGAHNWGTFKDDVEGQEQDHQNESADWSVQPDSPEKATENGDTHQEESEEGPKAEPEPVELTLDEWKALQASKNVNKPEFKIRETSNWTGKKGFEYRKKHDDEESEEEESEEEEEEDHRHGKKIVTDIRITFNDNPQRGGRGRGGRGRGGDRGRGRGEDRGDRGGFDGRGRGFGGRGGRGGAPKPREAAPRFDDEADFPSLVKLAA